MKKQIRKPYALVTGIVGFITVSSAIEANQGFSSIVESAASAVATISTSQTVKEPQNCDFLNQETPNGLDFDELEEVPSDFNESPQYSGKIEASGSGFVIKADQNSAYIVTNYHVIAKADKISIVLNDKTEMEATVLGVDDRSDLAVLRVSTKHLPSAQQPSTLEWADSHLVKVGEFVLALGNPFGLGNTTSHGIISNISRRLESAQTVREYAIDFIQHSAPINKGSSGGPLLNLEGKVIGINTAILSPNDGHVGIGLSIPSATAKERVRQLIEYGCVRCSWLGIKTQSISGNDIIVPGINKSKTYKVISDVTSFGPAAKAMITPGDVILEFDGREVTANTNIDQIIADLPIDESIKIKLLRDGEFITVDAIPEELKTAPHSHQIYKEPLQVNLVRT